MKSNLSFHKKIQCQNKILKQSTLRYNDDFLFTLMQSMLSSAKDKKRWKTTQ